MAAEADFTAAVVEASTAVVVAADFVEAASAVVDAPHSVVAGGRMADRLAARIVGVELIAEGDSHRAALADRHIAAAGSRHAARDLAPDHFPA
jgi:ATP-dependent exoDNAse (exonuclease V) alpha subunit